MQYPSFTCSCLCVKVFQKKLCRFKQLSLVFGSLKYSTQQQNTMAKSLAISITSTANRDCMMYMYRSSHFFWQRHTSPFCPSHTPFFFLCYHFLSYHLFFSFPLSVFFSFPSFHSPGATFCLLFFFLHVSRCSFLSFSPLHLPISSFVPAV